MPLIDLADIGKTVDAPRGGAPLALLNGVDFRVEVGERVAVLGRSGSGKSTLLSIIGMLAPATSGTYRLGGTDVRGLRTPKRDALRARTFGFIFQRFCLMAHLTAVENVEMALIHQGVARARRRERSLCALADVGLAARTGHRPAQLSGGEQQRVALARALVVEPAVILADEPTGSLDEQTGTAMMALMNDLATARGASMVVVTHDPLVIGAFDRTVVIEQGRLVPS